VDGPDSSDLAGLHVLGDDPVRRIVTDPSAGLEVEIVWRNEPGGLTFRFDDRFVK